MCLGIPGRILEIVDDNPVTRRGRVSFGGLVKEVNLAFVPQAVVNDFVIVHVGFGISVVDESEALLVFDYLREMDELKELAEPAP